MIGGLTPVTAAQQILGRLASVQINALLQLGIEVLKAHEDGTFLIKMGRHTFTTKSQEPLIPGREYWVQMRQSKEGIVYLDRLIAKPALLKRADFGAFDPKIVEELAQKSDPAGHLKEHLLHQMAAAPRKETFENLAQMLLSLHHGILSLPLKRGGKRMLLQMRRPRRNRDLNQKSVEFYAAMNNIGPLEGKIVQTEEKKHLRLSLYYPKSVALLQKSLEDLEGFASVRIDLAHSPVQPYFDGEKSGLLDIKG